MGERSRGRQPGVQASTPEDFGFGQLFWEIRDAVVVGDAETGCIVLWNPAAADLFGIPVDEAIGLPIETLVPEALRERHRAGLAGFRETGGGSLLDAGQPVELPALRRTGEPITIELTLSPIAASRIPGRFVLAIIRDATTRKQAEMDRLRLAREQAARAAAEAEAARQGEAAALLDALFAAAPDGFALFDRDLRFVRVNPALAAINGLPIEAHHGRTPREVVPAIGTSQETLIQRVLETGGPIRNLEVSGETLAAPGQERHWLVSYYPVHDQTGSRYGVGAVVVEITDSKRTGEALRQSEERFRTAFDHAAIGMDLVDLAGRFLQVNAALCALTGYSEPELLTKSFQDITHAADLAADLAQVDQLLAGEIRAFQMEKRYRRKDGTVVWGRITTSLLRDGQGDPLYFISQIEDITARKRTQEELRRSEARFRSLIVNATDLITILTADGTILYESPPIERMLGYHGNELVGRNAFDLVHPEDRAATRAAFDRALADPALEPMVEFRCRHKDGSWRWLEATGTNLLADDDVGGFVVNSRDITDRKRANEELRTVLEEAQAANRAKGLFLDMMSHELRTPLQAVLGYSESLLGSPEASLTAEQREDIGYIHKGGGRMIALINQLLDLSRMEAGRLDLATDPVDLVQVIEQVRQDVAPQAAAKALAVQVDLPPFLPEVIGDAERLRQILLNLVGNAVKFTIEGGVHITATVTSTGGVEVAVSDTGIGISREMMPLIFEEFRQVDGNLTRRQGGAGLGLAIARKLAEQMGGNITVSSEPHVGSTFRLHLPVGQQ